MMYCLSAVWLLLGAAATADSSYGASSADSNSDKMMYQGDEYIEFAPRHRKQVDEADAALLRDLLLFKHHNLQLREVMQEERREHQNRKFNDMAADDNNLAKRLAYFGRRTRSRRQMDDKTQKAKGCLLKICTFTRPG